MKQPPQLDRAQERMAPGIITRDGLLGSDRRALAEILEDDDNRVRRLGLTHEQIAERMDYFTHRGRPGLGSPVVVDDRWEVRVDEWRGGLTCPWEHAGFYRKSISVLINRRLGERMEWTALSIHMIRAHGFYGGRGNAYRIDPARAKRILEL